MGIRKLIIFQLLISMGLSLVPVLGYAQSVVGSLPIDKLIREKGGIRVYVLNEFGYKRHIANPEVFNSYGFKWEDIAEVSITEMDNYSESLLIREANDTKVYFIEDGKKRWVNSVESFAGHNFDWKKVHVINDTDIKAYTTGDTVAAESTIRETTSDLPIRAPRKADAPVSDSGKPDLRITAPKKPGLPNKLEEAPRIEKETVLEEEVRVPFMPGGGTLSPVVDTIRPAAIIDLVATSVQSYIETLDSQLGEADYNESALSTSSVVLTWTSPGDDGNSGTASVYDIRYSTNPHVKKGWSRSAIMVDVGEGFIPRPAGTVQSKIISGLSAGTTYYFLIRTKDEANNKSTKSNIVSVTTLSASDITAPSSITSLTASNPTGYSIDLSWNAPGDDGNTGTATSYDIRYSAVTITGIKWRLATQVSGGPTPQIAGTSQSMTVSGLSLGVKYYFTIRTSDEAPNWSNFSNIVSLATVGSIDYGAPSAITSLTASNPTATSIALSWNAPGDDGNTGTATSYDVRYSTSNITEGNWSSAIPVSGEPIPQVSGSSESLTVSGRLSPRATYYFAVKTKDEVPNESGISNVVNRATITCASFASGSQTFGMRSGPGMPQIQRITVDPLDYQIGSPQTIKVRVRDTSGNMITSVSVVFTTDSGTTTVPLPFLSGSASKSYWFGSWTPTDTRCVTYSIAVIATSASGTSQSILSPQ